MSVTTPHPDYTAMLPIWEDLRNAYIGETAIKGAEPRIRVGPRDWTQPGMRYLPRPSGMTEPEEYAAFLSGASWTPGVERAVHSIVGAIFRHDPQVTVPTAMEDHLADITQTGVTLRLFAEYVVRETLNMGRHGLLVDFPGPVLTADGQLQAPPPSSRPYCVGYHTEQITNWRFRQQQGKKILTMVEVKEVLEEVQGPWGTPDFFVVKPRTQYRVLRLNDAGFYEVSLWSEVPSGRGQIPAAVVLQQAWMPTRQGQPLDFIPFVMPGPFSLEPIIQKSLLEGLMRRNLLNFRHSADIEWGRHLSCMPTLFVASNVERPDDLKIGASQAVFLQDNNSKWGYAEPTGYGIPGMENAIKEDLMLMAALGARLLEGPPTTQETATGVQWRLAGSDSPTQTLVSVVSQALTWALQVYAWWAGFTDNVDDPAILVQLNKDLISTRMEPQMLLALMQARITNTISPQMFYYNLQGGEVAIPGVSFEEEEALLEIQREQQPLAAPAPGPGRPPAGQNGAARQTA